MSTTSGSKIQREALEYALFLCRGRSAGPCREGDAVSSRPPIVVIDEAETPDFEEQLRSEAPSATKLKSSPQRVVLLSTEAGTLPEDEQEAQQLLEKYWDINLKDAASLSSPLVSSYHSRATRVKGEMCLEIGYNISEALSYVANNTSPLDSTPSVSSRGPTDMVLQHQYEPLYFRHNLTTGQTTYIILDPKGDLRDLIHGVNKALRESGSPCTCPEASVCICNRWAGLHPFALQSSILFFVLSARTTEIDNLVKWLLWIETQLHQGSLFEITDSEKFSKYIQLLHKMSRNLITLEHNNQRDASNIDHLLRDHARLGRLAKRYSNGAVCTEVGSHERVRDDLLALRDFCEDRHRRILNLRQRTNNFITLLYNLITGHDSSINLRIAAQSANIARESRKDSMSMKVIAGLTLLYLPAMFVCSLFGTNLIALDTSTSGEPTFVVSRLWWMYLAFAVPLTVLTMSGFLLWRRLREQRKKERDDKPSSWHNF
ncbi:hypothetical protein FQN54_008905 [Arachnomyces sp. PD_36]|nr:hypothetical protein FQN54_008905 [Arachnomyces sp. PD_36]